MHERRDAASSVVGTKCEMSNCFPDTQTAGPSFIKATSASESIDIPGLVQVDLGTSGPLGTRRGSGPTTSSANSSAHVLPPEPRDWLRGSCRPTPAPSRCDRFTIFLDLDSILFSSVIMDNFHYDLATEQLQSFQERGYLLVRGFLDPTETKLLQQWAQEVHDLPHNPVPHGWHTGRSMERARMSYVARKTSPTPTADLTASFGGTCH
jgi:hypothetical protein